MKLKIKLLRKFFKKYVINRKKATEDRETKNMMINFYIQMIVQWMQGSIRFAKPGREVPIIFSGTGHRQRSCISFMNVCLSYDIIYH